MKRFCFLLCFCLFSHSLHANESGSKRHAITYYGDSRFGDRVLGYANARYLSYLTSIPFLYRAFPYSEHLSIEYDALPYDEYADVYPRHVSISSPEHLTEFFRQIRDPNTPSTLYVVNYFPSDITEWDNLSQFSLLIDIPWNDPKFSAYLKACFTPKIPIPDFTIKGILNVADHVRTLSGQDIYTSIVLFPLKHPTLDYHKRQIRKVYEWNLRKPMHVFLFSDTKNRAELLKEFQTHFAGCNILFDIQYMESVDTNYVLQDFFAMQKFDVLIATQSNFSMMASRLGSFDMILYPVHSVGNYPNSKIDRVKVTSKVSSWFPYAIDMILKEDLSKL